LKCSLLCSIEFVDKKPVIARSEATKRSVFIELLITMYRDSSQRLLQEKSRDEEQYPQSMFIYHLTEIALATDGRVSRSTWMCESDLRFLRLSAKGRSGRRSR